MDCDQAQTGVEGFVAWSWYNEEHRHRGISFVTPAQRHAEMHEEFLADRHQVYEAAKAKNPRRWSRSTRNWDSKPVVRLSPRPAAKLRDTTDNTNPRVNTFMRQLS